MRIVLAGNHPKLQHGFDAIERALVLSTEAIAGVLVAAEIVLLLIGVVARYVFRHSLVWSDSLASLLFLWLAMMGAVIAFQRGEHMRMGTFVRAASPRWQPFFQALAVVAPLAFLLLVCGPTIDYVLDEAHLTDPALNISNAWRAAAMPAGVFLMIASSLFQLARLTHWRPVLGALLLTVLGGGGLAALQPLLADAGSWNLVLFFVGVVALCVFSGVPIAFSFGLASFGYLSLTTSIPLLVMASRMDQGMSQIVLLAVPLFVILGLLMEMTGMAKALVEFLANLLGHVPGGLSYVLVGAMYLVSGISGSKSADMAALAPVLYPEMRARGTRPGEFVALLSATAAQTETIPPSLVLIILGSVTNTSIGALFTGGLLPGLVAGLMLCALVWWRNRGGRLADGAAPGERRARNRPQLLDRAAGARVAIRDPLRGGRRHRDRDRGVDDRHRLHDRRGPVAVPPVRLAADVADPGWHRGAVRCDPADHRRGDQHGMVPDAVRLFRCARRYLRETPRRTRGVRHCVDCAVHRARQSTGRHSGDRAVRTAAVSDRAGSRIESGSLRDDRDSRDGHGAVRAAVRRRLLHGVRDQPDQPRRRHAADRGVYGCVGRRGGAGCGGALDFDRIPVSSRRVQFVPIACADRRFRHAASIRNTFPR